MRFLLRLAAKLFSYYKARKWFFQTRVPAQENKQQRRLCGLWCHAMVDIPEDAVKQYGDLTALK